MRLDRGLPISNLPALGQYKSLDGMKFNHNTGEIKFQLTPWHSEMPTHDKLFTLADLGSLFENHLGAAFFSLDQADPDMQYHPFNQMRFAPQALEGTSLIQTMFLTDYVLKFLTMSQEVQGHEPYALRSVNTLLEGLPAHLQAIAHDFYAASQHKHSAHRFWIEATEAHYAINTSRDGYSQVTQVVVPEVKMVVKKHAMKPDAHGKLIDTSSDDEGWEIYLTSQNTPINEHLLALEEHAIVFITKNNQVKVYFWDKKEFSSAIALSGNEKEKWFAVLNEQERGDQGKIKKNHKNDQLIYTITKQVTKRFNQPHHFSPEYIFSQSLTEHYQEFSQYFPEFARLRAFSQIMIFVRLLDHVYESNKAEMSGIEERLHDAAFWANARNEAEENRRENQRSYEQQYASKKFENRVKIQEQFLTLRSEISESALVAEHRDRLRAMAVDMRTLYQDSPLIKKMVDENYQENEKHCIQQHGTIAWNRSKEGIRQQILGMRSQWVKEGNQARKKALIQSFSSALPSESSWTIEEFVRQMMDDGDVSELAALLAENQYHEALTTVVASYPFSVSMAEVKDILEYQRDEDDLAERLTTWQFSSHSQQAQEIYERQLASIREAKSELRGQLASRKLFSENLIELGASTEHNFSIERSEEAKLWIPACIHQEAKDGQHRLVYGGVNLMPKIEAMSRDSGEILIEEVFSSSEKRTKKTSDEVVMSRKFFQENSPGKLVELAERQWAAEEQKNILAEKKRLEEERQKETQRRQEEEIKFEENFWIEIQRQQAAHKSRKEQRQHVTQRKIEEEQRIQSSAEQARQLKQEAEERASQKRIVEMHRQAEERERMRQKEERKITFIEQSDVQYNVESEKSPVSTTNIGVINRTITSSENFLRINTTAQDQHTRDAYRDTYVEGLGIIVEEDQLFYQYITDAQGNIRKQLSVIFYPADTRQGWPGITAADYLIRKSRSLGKEDLIKKLKEKGIQESSGTQGGVLALKLVGDRYNQLRTTVSDEKSHYAGAESYNRTVIFRDTVNALLQEYKARIFSWHSKSSAAFIKKWTKLISVQQTADKLDRLVFSISELMQEKNNAAGESRLRDSLLKLWHTGLYLMAREEQYLDKIFQAYTKFFFIPLYPIEMRTSHPYSQDTVGSYLLRIYIEVNNIEKISALLAKGVEPPVDVILPKGMQSANEISRAENLKKQVESIIQENERRKEVQQQQRATEESERARKNQLAMEERVRREQIEMNQRELQHKAKEELMRQKQLEADRKFTKDRQRAEQQRRRELSRQKKATDNPKKKTQQDNTNSWGRSAEQSTAIKAELPASFFGSKSTQKDNSALKHPANGSSTNGGGKPPGSPPVTKKSENGGSSSGGDSSDEGSVSSLTDNYATVYRRKKVKGYSLHDMSDALRHRVVLALQEAGVLDKDEKLTEGAVNNSDIILEGEELKNKSVIVALTKSGDYIGDWRKLKTQAIEISTGQRIEVHFYHNRNTGLINYTHHDFKVKNSVDSTMINRKSYKKK